MKIEFIDSKIRFYGYYGVYVVVGDNAVRFIIGAFNDSSSEIWLYTFKNGFPNPNKLILLKIMKPNQIVVVKQKNIIRNLKILLHELSHLFVFILLGSNSRLHGLIDKISFKTLKNRGERWKKKSSWDSKL